MFITCYSPKFYKPERQRCHSSREINGWIYLGELSGDNSVRMMLPILAVSSDLLCGFLEFSVRHLTAVAS